ncbi:2-hydroxychromene-2-carboxylate isomerase [Luteibacter rhizovicinus]|uniref:2-hydroxychromene-2-carboxylate isomerase n=1 Tax=Luteibacter rhizovicinus TaxID=242606 RepID=A0A4V2W420_9GAMM|nr:2-hydroxychromene-2-carboxylate isomerase [Luteibacter rhizovicinus]TCV94009.1 2-hydroxychromene-2-carboxylate isomerase [Luteibacter rhizovicinus]
MPVVWYFDFISPFAWLQWPRIRELAATREVTLRPILFGALLNRLDIKGPAEIPHKREFSYRYVLWRARRAGQPLVFPPTHPFNPLLALRLCIAAGATVATVDAIFDWIWGQGRAADTPEAIAPLAESLGISDLRTALSAPDVKAALQANFEAAMAAGLFGVPTLAIGPDLFWGGDAHEFAMEWLENPSLASDPEMLRVVALPVGASRL